MANTLTYSKLRKELKSAFDETCRIHEPIHISRRNGENVVILSEKDFISLEETAYLLRSPANARRLLEAVSRKGGKSLKEVSHALGI